MAVTRTKEVTVADAWGNDVGGVTVEIRGRKVHLSTEEAFAFAHDVVSAAVEAQQAAQAKFDAERSLAGYRDRMVLDDVEDVIR